jgi:hypothetical protein
VPDARAQHLADTEFAGALCLHEPAIGKRPMQENQDGRARCREEYPRDGRSSSRYCRLVFSSRKGAL